MERPGRSIPRSRFSSSLSRRIHPLRGVLVLFTLGACVEVGAASTREAVGRSVQDDRGSPAPSESERAPVIRRAADRYASRLGALVPTQPADYFDLAEEIADGARSDADLRLARDLFARAGALRPESYLRSACLAIAALPGIDELEQTRLRLAAMLLDTRSGGIDDAPVPGLAEVSPEVAMAFSEAMSLLRRGLGVRSKRLLDQPEVAAVLEAHRGAIDVDRIRSDAQAYRGSARPTSPPAELARILRVEVGLLAPASRPWSSDLLVTDDRPLVEADPGRLEELLGVDPSQVYWRDGGWRRAP